VKLPKLEQERAISEALAKALKGYIRYAGACKACGFLFSWTGKRAKCNVCEPMLSALAQYNEAHPKAVQD
jgi:hypothetical protein